MTTLLNTEKLEIRKKFPVSLPLELLICLMCRFLPVVLHTCVGDSGVTGTNLRIFSGQKQSLFCAVGSPHRLHTCPHRTPRAVSFTSFSFLLALPRSVFHGGKFTLCAVPSLCKHAPRSEGVEQPRCPLMPSLRSLVLDYKLYQSLQL